MSKEDKSSDEVNFNKQRRNLMLISTVIITAVVLDFKPEMIVAGIKGEIKNLHQIPYMLLAGLAYWTYRFSQYQIVYGMPLLKSSLHEEIEKLLIKKIFETEKIDFENKNNGKYKDWSLVLNEDQSTAAYSKFYERWECQISMKIKTFNYNGKVQVIEENKGVIYRSIQEFLYEYILAMLRVLFLRHDGASYIFPYLYAFIAVIFLTQY